MPKINLGKNTRQEQIDRNFTIIKNATRIQLGSMHKLAAALGVNYDTLYASLKSGSIRAVDMAAVIRVLNMDNETVLALMGKKKKCRFEVGYEPDMPMS